MKARLLKFCFNSGSQSARNLGIDGFRGLLLVVIAINHLEGSLLTPFTREPFGAVSAAEAFIFLSGLVAAIVYGRCNDNPAVLKNKVWRRLCTLYAHSLLATLVIILLLHLGWLSDIWYQDQDNYFLLQNYLQQPLQAIFMSILQLQQMGYLDILVAYMLPMVFLPWALLALRSGRGVWVLVASLSVWTLAQTLTDTVLRSPYNWLSLDINIEVGYLDAFAWQLYFYLGVCCGYWQRFNELQFIRGPIVSFIVLSFAVIFSIAHHWHWGAAIPWLSAQMSWQDAGLVRVINTLLLAYCVAWLIQRRFIFFSIRPLVYLGQHSLQVFTFHAVAIYIFLPWMYKLSEDYHWWQDLSLTLFFILSLFAPAFLHQRWRERRALSTA